MDNYVGDVLGIEGEYQVFALGPDEAVLTLYGDEVVRFASAMYPFINAEDILEQAREVVFQIEEEEWD